MRHFRAMLRKLDNTAVKGYWPAAELVASLEPSAHPPAHITPCLTVLMHDTVAAQMLTQQPNVPPSLNRCRAHRPRGHNCSRCRRGAVQAAGRPAGPRGRRWAVVNRLQRCAGPLYSLYSVNCAATATQAHLFRVWWRQRKKNMANYALANRRCCATLRLMVHGVFYSSCGVSKE